LFGYDLNAKEPSAQYVAAQAFAGDYEITVSRVYGQPLGNRARLVITQYAGTPEQTRRIEVVNVEHNAVVKVNVKKRPAHRAVTVAPAAHERRAQPARNATPAHPRFACRRQPELVRRDGLARHRPLRGVDGSPRRQGDADHAKRLGRGRGVQLTTQVRQGADAVAGTWSFGHSSRPMPCIGPP